MRETLQKSVTHLLRPLVRLLLRHGVSHAEFSSWARQVYVREAMEFDEAGEGGRKPTQSRIAILTGINRKEVKRLMELPLHYSSPPAKFNRAARVVTGWVQDPTFQTDAGDPAVLEYGGPEDSFNQLVRLHGGDVPARAVLDELLRAGTVSSDGANRYRLLHAAYVPADSPEDLLKLFGQQSADLLNTMNHNLSADDQDKRLQLSVVYDNLPAESLEKFRQLSSEKGMQLLRELDEYLSTHDRDINPDSEGSNRCRAGLGLYLIEDTKQDRNDD